MPVVSSFRLVKEAITGESDIRNPIPTWQRSLKEFGPIYRYDFLGKPLVVVTDATEYEKILRACVTKYPAPLNIAPLKYYNEQNMKNDPNYVPYYHLTEGEFWRKTRTIIDEKLLHPKEVEKYIPELSAIASEMVQVFANRAHDGKIDGLKDMLYSFSVEGIGYVVFGYRMGGLASKPGPEISGMLEDLHTLMRTSAALSLAPPFYSWFPTPTYKEMVKAAEANWAAIFAKKADDFYAQRPSLPRHDLLHHQRTRGLSETECVKNAFLQFQAGSDSTTHATSWLLHNLGRNPEVQQKLRESVQAVLKKGEPVTPEVLGQLRYLKAVVKESLRLTPVASGLPRTLPETLVVCGYEIPAGTELALLHVISNHDPAFFEEPEKFLPERWQAVPPCPRVNAFYDMPFGFGPRMCQGFRVAELEIYCLLTHLVQHFKWTHSGPPANPVYEIFFQPQQPMSLTWERLE